MSTNNPTSSPASLIKAANEAFRSENYSKAIELYQEIIRRDNKLAKIFEVNLMIANNRLTTENHRPNEPIALWGDATENISYESAFNANWYVENYPDTINSELEPFEHYKNYGHKEGRWPNPWFDPIFYSQKYQDVKSSGLEPLDHYLKIGKAEKRATVDFFKRKAIYSELPRVPFSDTQESFVEFKTYPPLDCALKCIAFYLPQFHPFPENDEWWGKGFTEWTNVTKAKPNYHGHYQPHLPIHLGFYDLRLPEVLEEQAKLARNYGIYGFNFYYYWFDSKILMHRPFEILLENPQININYCITWANENWTRRWDGAEQNILIAQNHSEADSLAFIRSLLKFFKDPRYITVNKKPVLTVYRPELIPEIKNVLELWRKEAKKAGFSGLYLMATQTFGLKDPTDMGFDAAVEFPPHTAKSNDIKKELKVTNENYVGHIYSYEEAVQNVISEDAVDYKRLRGVMLGWDNTARKQDASNIFHGFSNKLYKQWLDYACNETFTNPNLRAEEKLVFINAWNEWGEGTHLEPDRLRGFGALAATRDALANYDAALSGILLSPALKKSRFAVIVHAHYLDIWDQYDDTWKILKDAEIDTYITVTKIDRSTYEKILNSLPQCHIRLIENRGRDILPFIKIYKEIKPLGYDAICKIHLKKSLYRKDGDELREKLIRALIGNKDIFRERTQNFIDNPRLGLTVESSSVIKFSQKNMLYNTEKTYMLVEYLKLKINQSIFSAGSMFWFRPEAFKGLESLESHFFEIENGLSDGTLAHAVERLFCVICENNGFEILPIGNPE